MESITVSVDEKMQILLLTNKNHAKLFIIIIIIIITIIINVLSRYI